MAANLPRRRMEIRQRQTSEMPKYNQEPQGRPAMTTRDPLIGIGTDSHRLEPGDGIRLGGVLVPCRFRAVAHSDGDTLLHALTDAILGAIGDADIGDLFPPTDENRNRPSADFVREALRRIRASGRRVGNMDAVIRLEEPKLGPFKNDIRESLAGLLGVEHARIGVKAKTAEGLGPVGRSECVECEVAVLVV